MVGSEWPPRRSRRLGERPGAARPGRAQPRGRLQRRRARPAGRQPRRPAGAIVALLGANGAGKTTLLRAITGLLGVHRGEITKGIVELEGEGLAGLDAPAIVRRGVSQVMEGRRIFAELTVDENLRAGAFTRRVEGRGARGATSA